MFAFDKWLSEGLIAFSSTATATGILLATSDFSDNLFSKTRDIASAQENILVPLSQEGAGQRMPAVFALVQRGRIPGDRDAGRGGF